MQDAFAWSIGTYVLEAIASAFDGNTQYPSEPRFMTSLRDDEHIENEIAAEKFWRWAEAFNAKR